MGSQSGFNWNDLVGLKVQLHKGSHVIRAGFVEEVTYNGDALWLRSQGAETRALYLKDDGYTVRTIEEYPTSCNTSNS